MALTNAAGTLVERYTYSAYGVIGIYDPAGTVRTNSTYANRYTYTGREYDPDLNLYHFRARWYDPATGGFVSRDPLWYVDGMSVYRGYFGVRGLDPSGFILKHEGAHYRCPSQREYMRLRDRQRRGAASLHNAIVPPLTDLYDRVRRQLLLCCSVTRASGARERIDASCEYNFYDRNGDAIVCEIEVEKIIRNLRNAKRNIEIAGKPTYCNPSHALWEHGIGPGAGYYCDQCQSEFSMGITGTLLYFSVENVMKAVTFSLDYSSHSWSQIRCNADGLVYGQVDFWADFKNPWRDGINDFGYYGRNYNQLYEDWARPRRSPEIVDRIAPLWSLPKPPSSITIAF